MSANRKKRNPQRGRHIRLRSSSQDRELPLLILQGGGDVPDPMDPELRAYRTVVNISSARYEFPTDLAVPVAHLYGNSSVAPVTAPGLNTLSGSSHPITEQLAFVCIEVVIEAVKVNEMSAVRFAGGNIGVSSFDAQIEFPQPRKLRYVNTRINSRAAGWGQRGRFIVPNRIRLHRQPGAKKRNPVPENQSPPSLTLPLTPRFSCLARLT